LKKNRKSLQYFSRVVYLNYHQAINNLSMSYYSGQGVEMYQKKFLSFSKRLTIWEILKLCSAVVKLPKG
jgi:hypothetical protein